MSDDNRGVPILRLFQLFDRFLTARKIGLTFGVIAFLIGLWGYRNQHGEAFVLAEFLKDFYANLSTELGSIALVVLLIDVLYERSASRQEQQRLILQMGSPDHGFAIEAVRALRSHRVFWGMGSWLSNGSLRGQRFYEANLKEGRLEMADLRRAYLRKADLTKATLIAAQLQSADLRDAKMLSANLNWANLQRANLQGAILTDANLALANLLEVANLRDQQIMNAFKLMLVTMPDGRRYDGRFNLGGDIQQARGDGIDVSDPVSMSRFYQVSLEEYQYGQEWARANLSKLRGEEQDT